MGLAACRMPEGLPPRRALLNDGFGCRESLDVAHAQATPVFNLQRMRHTESFPNAVRGLGAPLVRELKKFVVRQAGDIRRRG